MDSRQKRLEKTKQKELEKRNNILYYITVVSFLLDIIKMILETLF